MVETGKQICLQKKSYFLLYKFYSNGYVLLCNYIYILENCDNFLHISVCETIYTDLNDSMLNLIRFNDIFTQMRGIYPKGQKSI